MAGQYGVLTGVAQDFINVATTSTEAVSTVAQNLVLTAGAEPVVGAAVLGGVGYYGYRRYNAE